MKLLRSLILYGALAISLGLLWHTAFRSPCDRVVEYDLGIFDERFNISREAFLAEVSLAELPWEDAAGRELFRYREGADFKVNLIFSDEQGRLYQGNEIEAELEDHEASIDDLGDRYQAAVGRYERARRDYETRLLAYEDDVTYWNSRGGAPEAEYQDLQAEAGRLDDKAKEVKTLLAQVNRIASENNEQVEAYNDNVNAYNELFDKSYEFDSNNTATTEINIYSYDGLPELHTLLVHEFGHVLGIEHVEDPASVMYYLLNEQNQGGELTDVDVAALKTTCRL